MIGVAPWRPALTRPAALAEPTEIHVMNTEITNKRSAAARKAAATRKRNQAAAYTNYMLDRAEAAEEKLATAINDVHRLISVIATMTAEIGVDESPNPYAADLVVDSLHRVFKRYKFGLDIDLALIYYFLGGKDEESGMLGG